jgi:hypothetical protein
MHYKNPNPSVVRYSLHAHLLLLHVLLLLPTVFSSLHTSPPKITFLPGYACIQQAPNIDMWLILSHLNFVCFFNLSCKSLGLLYEFLCLHLSLRGLLSECIQCLHCNLFTDHLCAFFLSLCHVLLCLLCPHNEIYFPLLERFHLNMSLLLLCLHDYEFYLQLLHIPCSFEVLSDRHHLLPMLEVLDSCDYLLLFLVPLLDLLILLHLCPYCASLSNKSAIVQTCRSISSIYVVASFFLCSLTFGGVVGMSCSWRFSISCLY